MHRILIDTCVWLDLAKDYQQQSLVSALEEMIKQKQIELILPRTIVEEFDRNKARIVEESSRSLSGTLKRVKDAVEKFGDPRQKELVLRELNDVDHRLPTAGEAAEDTISRIEALFTRSSVLEVSDAVKLRAAQRAIDKRAPFHRQRNGIDDAILVEVYADIAVGQTAPSVRSAFVSHNIKDFSHTTVNNKLPHPDIASCFSGPESCYFITLGEALKAVAPDYFSDLMIEEEWFDEPRRLSDIGEAIDEFVTKVWYNRHQNTKYMIERGSIKVVEKETFPVKNHLKRPIQRDIWEGAQRAAAAVEERFGLGNLGPWTDFEWGMLNGKLSALRWVLGDEWDMLDS